MEPLLAVDDVRVSFDKESGSVPVLNGVDLNVQPGESIGIVGESGAGKTVLVRTILNLLQEPWTVQQGSIRFDGEDLLAKQEEELREIRGVKIALTSPEPRKQLNPLVRVGEQLAHGIRAHRKITRKEALELAVEALESVGIPDPHLRVRAYPHELSGGMCQRVVIAMALSHSPKLLLADEPTAGLDVTIARQILDLMAELVHEFGSSLMLVSRDMGVVAHYCQRVAVMYAGQIVEVGETEVFYGAAAHPYSRHLLRAARAARDDRRAAAATVEARAAATQGCAYAPRCPVAIADCEQSAPALEPVDDGHAARCFRRGEVARGEVQA